MLSVALCTYNGEKYIEEQIRSILEQTVPVDEIVVCDDGSTDNTVAIVARLADVSTVPIRLHRNDAGLGVVGNFKKATALCQGDIVFYSDQDDRWHLDKVAEVTDYFKYHPDCSVVFTDALIINSEGEYKEKYGNLFQMTFQKEEQRMFHAGMELESFLARNHATGATMAVKRNFLEEAHPFQLCTKNILHDYALALRATELGVLGVIHKPLIDYRRHDRGQTIFEIPEAGKASKWYTYYDHIRELWPNCDTTEIQTLLTANHAQERINYIATRNKHLHNYMAALLIPFSMKTYRRMYGGRWLSAMRYDIVQCIRYSWLRLTHKLPEK